MCDFELHKIKKSIKKHFKFLFDLGFRFHSAKHQIEHMGFWEVILQYGDLFVKFYNDRGEIMVEISQAHYEDWYGLSLLVYFITKGEQFIGSYEGNIFDRDKQLQRLSDILIRYIDDVRNLMGTGFKHNKQKLHETQQEVLDLYRKKYLESRSASELQKYVTRLKGMR